MRILVAEDDTPSRRLLEAVLKKWGYEVTTARDGTEAWELLQAPDAPPLAILDWMMPGMDGIDVCRNARNLRPARLLHIILLTTRGLREDKVAGLEAGANDYVTKPFDYEELRARVQVGSRVVELQQRLAEQARELEAEHQRSEHLQALMVERQRFDAAVAAMSDGIVVTNGHYQITTANRAACRLLNIPPEDPEGTSLQQALEQFALSTPPEELFDSRDSSTALEITRPNTRPPLCLDARMTRLFRSSGELDGALLTVRDITAQRHAQNVRADFFTLVSHKLRTPLAILSGYLSVCSQMPASSLEQISSVLQVCDRETRHLVDLVERLLEFKSIGTRELEAASQQTQVATVLDQAIVRLRDHYPARSLEITQQIEPEAAWVEASAEHVDFVLGKLLDNAVKFAGKEQVRIEVCVNRSGPGYVQFAISDNGPGIPHEYYDRIFEGFVQVEELVTGQVPGLGVGLFMARQVVSAYGGSMSIDSHMGSGATVSFSLPAALAPSEPTTPAVAADNWSTA